MPSHAAASNVIGSRPRPRRRHLSLPYYFYLVQKLMLAVELKMVIRARVDYGIQTFVPVHPRKSILLFYRSIFCVFMFME